MKQKTKKKETKNP